jgi:hypothetical protein
MSATTLVARSSPHESSNLTSIASAWRIEMAF